MGNHNMLCLRWFNEMQELHEGHADNVFCVAFSPGGRSFLSGSGTDAYDADLLRDLGIDNTDAPVGYGKRA
jgi:hypothetical protein